MNPTTRALFGGALFAAGITTAQAQQEFVINIDGWTTRVAADFQNLSPYDIQSTNPGDVSVYAFHEHPNPELDAYIRAGGDFMRFHARAESDNSLAAAAVSYGYFETTQTFDLQLAWKFEFNGACALLDTDRNPLAGVFQTGAGAGTSTITVAPGRYYVMAQAVSRNATSPDFATITFPGYAGPCDADANGLKNLDDVDLFVQRFLDTRPGADCDGNGALNLDDLDCFVACFLTP